MLWFRSSGQLPAFDSHNLIEGYTAAKLLLELSMAVGEAIG
jgi:hypothetical protein